MHTYEIGIQVLILMSINVDVFYCPNTFHCYINLRSTGLKVAKNVNMAVVS